MPIYDTKVASLQREVHSLQKKIALESSNVARARERSIRASAEMGRTTSATTRQSKQRALEAADKDAQKAEQRRADYEKQLAKKNADLHVAQQRQADERLKVQQQQADKQMKAQAKALKKLADDARRREAERPSIAIGPRTKARLSLPTAEAERPTPDLFIAHATEDKDEVARPLAERLRDMGLKVWYDEFELRIGGNLRREIDRGLATCRFGVPILSPDFFSREWPQWELDGLAGRHLQEGGGIILPVWHRISKDEVLARSPSLANLVALKTADHTITEIAERIAEVVRGG